MIARYNLPGVPCACCMHPVDHILVYRNAIVTFHESPTQPPCVVVVVPDEPPVGGAVDDPARPASSTGSNRRVA